MAKKQHIRLAFYGDDFTGSTDALEQISMQGARCILFTDVPSNEQLSAFGHFQAIGIAGKTRALPPAEMEKILMASFGFLKALKPDHVHYKICSTFDSSPSIGSIGKAIHCGKAVFENKLIPILGGMPSLGRYCVFGNLFAKMGIGSTGDIYRLDRHPSMSRHPVTPAHESDLRRHLNEQTNLDIGLIDILKLLQPTDKWQEVLQGEEVVLLDALYPEQLTAIGQWLDALPQEEPQFSVGGSGIETALGSYWKQTGSLPGVTNWPTVKAAQPLLVVSGSCSPISQLQITHAVANGFSEVVINPESLNEDGSMPINEAERIISLLGKGNHVVVHTGAVQIVPMSSEKLGAALGSLAKEAVKNAGVKRVLVSGGDTSSFTARSMEIFAVEMIAPLLTGAPLCKAYSSLEYMNELEVIFKGGQVGPPDYFLKVATGKMNS